jgi:hypothetical protein
MGLLSACCWTDPRRALICRIYQNQFNTSRKMSKDGIKLSQTFLTAPGGLTRPARPGKRGKLRPAGGLQLDLDGEPSDTNQRLDNLISREVMSNG